MLDILSGRNTYTKEEYTKKQFDMIRQTGHSLLILFLRLGLETRIPPVPKDCFGIVQVGNDILKIFDRANFDFL